MKIKRSTLVPAILTVYLGAMCVPGYRQYQSGQMSATEYFGIIAITLAVIVMLHFSLKRRERLRAERENDINSNNDKKQK
ncbi:hypothetical protein [Duncaniella dubosii]|uniref:hypothetical protein n=1 Tax=Duncaniella dubosii TaxID=2518971 RepID=UPI0032B1AAF8